MLFSKNSQLILRHSKRFKTKKVFFSGNIQDSLPFHLSTVSTKINFQKYNICINCEKKDKNIIIYHRLIVSKKMIENCDTVIYYWPKNKSEAKFQLINILSCFPIKTEIFIVGENSSGVRSAQLILKEWVELDKIDSAKHSILIFGFIKKRKKFILENFFKTHKWKDFVIKSLPGVFGHKKIDEGSKVLASTFSKNISGEVLDICCGTGFLSLSLLCISPYAILTLTDNDVTALKCSQLNLDLNKLTGKVIFSDFYSNILQKFDLIISNPPFHKDLKVDIEIIKDIICNSKKYLRAKGELRFVTNNCFNFSFLLKKTFRRHYIIKKTNQYKVYQAFLK